MLSAFKLSSKKEIDKKEDWKMYEIEELKKSNSPKSKSR